jgi:hypothetical protein
MTIEEINKRKDQMIGEIVSMFGTGATQDDFDAFLMLKIILLEDRTKKLEAQLEKHLLERAMSS